MLSVIHLEKHLGENVFHFGGREEPRAFWKNVLMKRILPRVAVERCEMLFDKKDVFSSEVERSGVLFGKRLFRKNGVF